MSNGHSAEYKLQKNYLSIANLTGNCFILLNILSVSLKQ